MITLLADGGTGGAPGFLESLAGFAATVVLIVVARLVDRYLPAPPPPRPARRRREVERVPDDAEGDTQ